MHIKTFRARTLRDALEMVRAEFGPGAAVLHTREVDAGPLARVLRGRSIEVAATPDHAPLAVQAAETGVAAFSLPKQLASPSASRRGAPGEASSPGGPAYGRLIEADLAPELASSLLVESPADPVAALERRIAVSGPIDTRPGRRVVALVGPTGVGKTTTLAKLAANYRLRDHARVGLVTVDTYRVAAVDQLRTYADIIDLPMEVVATPAEMRRAVEKLAGLDLVLIDTAGRSPRDEARIDELRALLGEARPDETHLVLSTTATAAGLRDAVRRFGVVRPTSLLLTKLDESPTLGHAAAPLVDAGLPGSYLTDGQSVPEDIRVAERRALAERILTVGTP